jgi:hypothetical protein
VCNRTRNEHFACLEQAAKFNFAAVALTTAVKVKVISIFIYYHNYNISITLVCGVILQNLDWVQLKFDLCQFFVSGTAAISTEFLSGLKFLPISNEWSLHE